MNCIHIDEACAILVARLPVQAVRSVSASSRCYLFDLAKQVFDWRQPHLILLTQHRARSETVRWIPNPIAAASSARIETDLPAWTTEVQFMEGFTLDRRRINPVVVNLCDRLR